MFRSAVAVAALLILQSLVPVHDLAGQQVTHEVTRGETLWSIAQQYLGDGSKWTVILEANRDRIPDPNAIEVGLNLIIPGAAAPPTAEVQEVTVVPQEEAAQAPLPAQEAPPVQVSTRSPCPGPNARTIFFGDNALDERGCTLEFPAPGERTAFYPVLPGAEGDLFVRLADRLPVVPAPVVLAADWMEAYGADIPASGTLSRLAQSNAEWSVKDRGSTHDRFQVTLEPGARLAEGDLLQSFRVVRAEEGFGQVVRPTGLLRVVKMEEAGLVAEVTASFDRVRLGDRIRLAPDYEPRIGVQPQAVESNLWVPIVGFAGSEVMQGFGASVFLGVGEDSGVAIGDEFITYVNQGEGWSGDEAARFQVILIHGGVATARIIKINEPLMELGTRVHLVKKMG